MFLLLSIQKMISQILSTSFNTIVIISFFHPCDIPNGKKAIAAKS